MCKRDTFEQDNPETKLMVKPRKKQLKRKLEMPHDSDESQALRTGKLNIELF